MTSRDVNVSCVGAVRPQKTDLEESDDDMIPVNRPAVCCAQLDDFGWVMPDYVPDILLSGLDIEVELTDLTQDIHVLPDVFPVVSAGAAAVPRPLPAVVSLYPRLYLRRMPLVVPLIDYMSTCHVRTGLRCRINGTDSGYTCLAGRVSGRVCRQSMSQYPRLYLGRRLLQ